MKGSSRLVVSASLLLFLCCFALLCSFATASDNAIFVYDSITNGIYSAHPSRSQELELIKGLIPTNHIAARKGWVYAVKETTVNSTTTQYIVRFYQDGTNEETLPISTSTDRIRGIAIDGDDLYVNINKKFRKYKLDGTDAKLVSSAPATAGLTPQGLYLGDDYIYFIATTDGITSRVYKVDRDDSSSSVVESIYSVVSADAEPLSGVVEIDGKVWVAQGTILRSMNDRGGKLATFKTTFSGITSIAAYYDDDDYLVVADSGVIYLVDLDTGAKTTAAQTLATPTALVSDEESPDISSSALLMPPHMALMNAATTMWSSLLRWGKMVVEQQEQEEHRTWKE